MLNRLKSLRFDRPMINPYAFDTIIGVDGTDERRLTAERTAVTDSDAAATENVK